MKIFILAILILFLSEQIQADTYVRGYCRKDGTYVAPHFRSDPNRTKRDNWSTKGNVNPHTGKPGTKNASSYGDLLGR